MPEQSRIQLFERISTIWAGTDDFHNPGYRVGEEQITSELRDHEKYDCSNEFAP